MAEKIYDVIRLKSTLLGDGSRWMEIEELTDEPGPGKTLAKIRYKKRASTSHNVYLGYPKKY
jgi:hypothetical protein